MGLDLAALLRAAGKTHVAGCFGCVRPSATRFAGFGWSVQYSHAACAGSVHWDPPPLVGGWRYMSAALIAVPSAMTQGLHVPD